MNKDKHKDISSFINDIIENINLSFEDRWNKVNVDIYNKFIHQCVGGLLARQSTLAIEIVKSPSIWNGNIAPIILRCMVDAHISLAWIFEDLEDRSLKYIHYGLGQEKLFIKFLEDEQNLDESDHYKEIIKNMIKVRKEWLNHQLLDWSIDVNVGSWSDINTREMARNSKCESLYKFAYVPFSGVAHNMWQHVGTYNMEQCLNPLHNNHYIPTIKSFSIDIDYMYLSLKYLTKSLELFDEKFSIKSSVQLPVDFFANHDFMNKPSVLDRQQDVPPEPPH